MCSTLLFDFLLSDIAFYLTRSTDVSGFGCECLNLKRISNLQTYNAAFKKSQTQKPKLCIVYMLYRIPSNSPEICNLCSISLCKFNCFLFSPRQALQVTYSVFYFLLLMLAVPALSFSRTSYKRIIYQTK